MKTVIALLLLLCASFMNMKAQTPTSSQRLVEIVDSSYIWPDNLKGTRVNVPSIVVDSQGWIFAAAVGNDLSDGLVWRSKDRGKTWEHLVKGLEDVFYGGVTSIYMLDDHTTLLASGINGIWRSVDRGDTWERTLYYANGSGVWCFIQTSGDTVFAGGATIWESTNRGATWFYIDESRLPSSLFWPISDFTKDENGDLFASLNGVLRSTDNGKTWKWANDGGPWFDGESRTGGITADNSGHIFLSSSSNTGSGKVFRSDNRGLNWKQVSNPEGEREVNCFTSSPVYGMFAGKSVPDRGLFNSTDGGDTWHLLGLREARSILSFAWLSADVLLIGTSDGMYIITLGLVTGVEESKTIPGNFSLSQNYPNPFNPSTSIKYQVSSSAYTTLVVYDILGKEVATLVNEEKFPGSYEVTFNASNLSSGIYFYRLQAGSFVQTRKMILIK